MEYQKRGTSSYSQKNDLSYFLTLSHLFTVTGQLAQTQMENSWIITAINNADVAVDYIEMLGMFLSPDYWCHPTCDWHCRASRSAGTPHHWSHCFHRNPLLQQNCEKGENQIKLINKPQTIARRKCCIKSSIAKWTFPTAAASHYMHLTGKTWVDSYYEVVAGNVLCLSVRVARKNVSAKQDNSYFGHFFDSRSVWNIAGTNETSRSHVGELR